MAIFTVKFEAEVSIKGQVNIVSDSVCYVTFFPSLSAASDDSGIPLNYLYNKAISYAAQLVADTIGMSRDNLYVEDITSRGIKVVIKGVLNLPSL